MTEREELASKVLISWHFSKKKGENFENNPELVNGGDFVSTMLYKKMQAIGLGVNIPDECLLMISVCSNSPGYAQLLLKEILMSIPDLKRGYTITVDDFVRKYPMEYPVQDNPKWDKYFQDLWDKQKNRSAKFPQSDNLCDTADWWLEVLHE